MLMEGGLQNFFTINGKAYPATDTLRMRVGVTIKLRIIGTNNNFIQPGKWIFHCHIPHHTLNYNVEQKGGADLRC
jgi:FtsP/CotA-like multicopper oxidase with cupredoxin domain